MKKTHLLFLILITIFLIGCNPEPGKTETIFIDDPIVTPEDHAIVGSWVKDNRVWHFYNTDDFLYCDYPDNTVLNNGTYSIINDNELNLIDINTGDEIIYIFTITGSVLSWFPKGSPAAVVEYVRVIE